MRFGVILSNFISLSVYSSFFDEKKSIITPNLIQSRQKKYIWVYLDTRSVKKIASPELSRFTFAMQALLLFDRLQKPRNCADLDAMERFYAQPLNKKNR